MMRSAARLYQSPLARLALVLAAFAAATAVPTWADVNDSGKKSLLDRLNPFARKETPPPAPPPAPPPPPKPAPAASGPKPNVVTKSKSKSSGGSSGKSSSSSAGKKTVAKSTPKKAAPKAPPPVAKKANPAPAPAVAKKQDQSPAVAKKEEPSPAPAAQPEEGSPPVTVTTTADPAAPAGSAPAPVPEGVDIPKMVAAAANAPAAAPAPAPAAEADTPPAATSPVSATAAAPAPAPAPAPAAAEKAKESEFEQGEDEPQGPVNVSKPTSSNAPEPSAPLPFSKNGGWQLVKVSGRDYVTGDSIHQFYRFSSYKVDGKHVWLRSNNLILKAQIGSQEMLINNIKFILSYPVLESGGKAIFSRLDLCKLIDPVLRPTYISDAVPFDTVVIDAGHGGHDVGARGIYGYEKDFALKMAFAVRDALTKRGFKVVLTRETDKFITLGGRVAIANSVPNSIFVSLHFNAGGNEAASGIETFALTPQGSSASLERGGGYNANGLTGNSHDSANIALATAVHAMVISKFKFVDRGIKRAQWSVLTGCKRPGILFEGGFVTNGPECRLIASDTYRQSVSTAIAEAITNYRTALRGAMTNRR